MTTAITDFGQFSTLRAAADRNDPAVLAEVAGQFEALFIQSMLENMRAASFGDPIFGESSQHEMYQDMLDKQLAVEMASGDGIGLADMLVRQLGGESSARATGEVGMPPYTAPQPPLAAARAPAATSQAAPAQAWDTPEAFAADVWPHAERIAAALGVPPEAVMAQTALETGWGAHVPQRADGSSSHNLFGIKAGSGWSGESVAKRTLEFEAGVMTEKEARFRAYDTVAASFDDYAAFISDNPRYTGVIGRGQDVEGFATALQDSGYATDPAYADKLSQVAHGERMQEIVNWLKFSGSPPLDERLPADST